MRQVDIGTGGDEFDVVVDEMDDALASHDDDPEMPPVVIGEEANYVDLHVDPLRRERSPPACARPRRSRSRCDLPPDTLLARCEDTTRVKPGEGEHAVTPLTAHYTATGAAGGNEPDVRAIVRSTAPDLDDQRADPVAGNCFDKTTYLDLSVVKDMPATITADVIPPITPDATKAPPVAGRRLTAVYGASAPIPSIGVELESRRANSVCEDPRPNRKAICLKGTLTNLPETVTTTYDPSDESGLIDITNDAPANRKLSVLPLHISKVSPDATKKPLVLDAAIAGLTPHVVAHIQSRELDGENPPGNPTLEQALLTCKDTDDDDGDGKIDAKDSDCESDPARISVDACPDDPSCDGVDSISFTATDQLVPDPQPVVPGGNLTDPPPALTPRTAGDRRPGVQLRRGRRVPRQGRRCASCASWSTPR